MAAQESANARNGRIGANKSWGQTLDWTARTEPARAGVLRKFEKQADPDGVLSPDERTKHAKMLRRAHMQRLAERSAKVRRLRAGGDAP